MKSSIVEHVTNYEHAWNCFLDIISRANLTTDEYFGKRLREYISSDKAKAEFLLKFSSIFYTKIIVNIMQKIIDMRMWLVNQRNIF
jgi:hypothetical protein